MKVTYAVTGAVLLAAVVACRETTALPSVFPSVILSTEVSSLAVTQGDRASLAVAIERTNGFAGPVTLDVAGTPAGVEVAVVEDPADADRASVTFAIGDATTPGVYPLQLTATGLGIATQALPLELHVAQRAPVPIAVRYCTGFEPFRVAFQDGDGTWIQAEPSAAGGTVAFNKTFLTNRGAIAKLVRLGNDRTTLSVQYGTPTELVTIGGGSPDDCNAAASKTLSGTATGLGADEFAFVNMGFFSRDRTRFDPENAFMLRDLPAGPQDLLATRITPTNGTDAITGMIVRRDIDLPDNATLPVLDFASPEAFAPAISNVSLVGLGSGGATLSSQLLTSHSRLLVTDVTGPTIGMTRPYPALPESRLLPGDLQVLFASTNSPTGTDTRSAGVYFRAPTDRTLALGAPLVLPALTAVATTPLRMRAQFVPQSDYDRSAGMVYQQGATTQVAVLMTAAYATITGKGYDLVVPDLSGVAGFDPAWALRSGETLLWSASRLGGTLPPGLDVTPSDGASQRTASGTGTIAP